MYSGKPAASIVVKEVVAKNHLEQPEGRRRLNGAGLRAVDATAERIAGLVDELLGKHWDRTEGTFIEAASISAMPDHAPAAKEVTCACGSGIPVMTVEVDGEEVTLTALPLLFAQFQTAGKAPAQAVARELLDATKIYNPVPAEREEAYLAMLLREYRSFCNKASAS
jgi:hypothetical protein